MAFGKRVLIVDPSERFLQQARGLLERSGYEVYVAPGMARGQRMARAVRPEIVLVGSRLPDGDGVRLARWMKQSLDTSPPCVLLCSKGEPAPPLGPAGADNFLVRPLKRSEILACVRAMALVHDLTLRAGAGNGTHLRVSGAPGGSGDPSRIRSPLTGFYTFSFFKETLYLEVKRARRYGYPVAVLLLEYDGDTLEQARAAGAEPETVFGGLALAIRRSIRETDFPVAYTEERVLILMPHTDLDGGLAVAKRIRAAMKRSRIRCGDQSVRPTLSLGLAASRRLDDMGFAALIKKAQRALEESIARGGGALSF